jgi:phosphonate transport system substrate-binding protein
MVMAFELQEKPNLADKIRIVEVIGPTPIPPWVIRRRVPEAQKTQVRQALLTLPETEDGRQLLQKYHLRGFTAVPDAHYDKVRQMITEAANVYWPL